MISYLFCETLSFHSFASADLVISTGLFPTLHLMKEEEGQESSSMFFKALESHLKCLLRQENLSFCQGPADIHGLSVCSDRQTFFCSFKNKCS